MTRPGITLEEALNEDSDLARAIESDSSNRELFSVAMRLEGQIRNVGTHAAGVIISDQPITKYCPLYRNGDDISTQFAMSHCEAIGLLKVDFLGLETLTQIEKTVALLAERNVTITIKQIPLDDAPTYDLLARGDARGVFQLESEGMREILRKLRPDRFGDIIALVALYRPGPLGSGMVDQYIRVKHGQEQATYKHPTLEPILEETNGVILYQEQVMRIAHDLAGFPLTDADNLRKAMGKKKPEIMARYRDQFLSGAGERGIDRKTVEEVWELILFFAGYGFNKSHSAAYALVAYQTAYLKANYPVEFMAALMTTHMGNTDKIRVYIEECSRTDQPVLGPDVNTSRAHFTTEEKTKIRYGLGAIKGVGQRAAETIHATRQLREDKFRSLYDFCNEIDLSLVNKKVLESLAKSGSFDSLGVSRAESMAEIEKALRMGQRTQKDRARGQQSLFGEATPQENSPRKTTDVIEWSERERLAHEKEALGFYFSGHPLQTDQQLLATYSNTTTRKLRDLEGGGEVILGGLITEIIPTVIRKGRNAGARMARVLIEDLEGSCRLVVFPDLFKQHQEILIPDQKIFVRGRVDELATEPTVLASELLTFEMAPTALTRKVTVHLPRTEIDPILEALRDLIKQHHGDVPLYLNIATEGGRVLLKTGQHYSVAPSAEFTRAALALVGEAGLTFSSV